MQNDHIQPPNIIRKTRICYVQLAKVHTFLKVAIWRTNQNHPPSKSFNPIVKFSELARLISSAVLLRLAEEHMLEEQRKEDAHHQAVSY